MISPEPDALHRAPAGPAAAPAPSVGVDFRLLVESVKDCAIFMLDVDGRVASWNAGARRIKGYDDAEIIGRHFSIFYPRADVDAGKPERELEVAIRDGRYEEEGERVRKDGSVFWASVVIEPVRDHTGELVGFAKVTRDLTEQRRAEQERIRLAQAQEALALRDEFLSIASHELRTPLTVMRLQLERLSAAANLPDRLAGQLERVKRGGERLTQLVDTLLDVSRVAAGQLRLRIERFDLCEAIREVVDDLRDQAAAAGVPLDVRACGAIEGSWDRLRVEQVITNLLTNAIKYGAGKATEIVATLAGEQAELRVVDHGPGIAERDLERIFGRFQRGASTRNFGGLGLGLYLSRQIVEAHGGTIEAASTPGEGAAFTVRLPLAARAAAEVA